MMRGKIILTVLFFSSFYYNNKHRLVGRKVECSSKVSTVCSFKYIFIFTTNKVSEMV